MRNYIKKDSLTRAKEYAFLLLKFRQRSEKEVYGRLKKKKFEDSIIKEAVTFLKNKHFIDDENFTRSWISQRLKQRYGIERIKKELYFKGIDKATIDSNFEEIRPQYQEEDIIRSLVDIKLKKNKDTDFRKVKNRIYSYLLRRGFRSESIADIINNKCRQI